MERPGDITFQGNPLTAIGPKLNVGDKAPDFDLLANDLSPVKLSDSAGKVRLIISVPSLDTPVCDMETRKFNEQLDTLGGGVAGYTISADLPFAQARWCGAAGVKTMQTLSDHRAMALWWWPSPGPLSSVNPDYSFQDITCTSSSPSPLPQPWSSQWASATPPIPTPRPSSRAK